MEKILGFLLFGIIMSSIGYVFYSIALRVQRKIESNRGVSKQHNHSKENKEIDNNPTTNIGKNILESSDQFHLFFDVETNGLPIDWKASVHDLDNWPRIVQIAWIYCDCRGNKIDVKDFIIKPEGFTISEESIKIHKISNEEARIKGHDLGFVLKEFYNILEKSDILVAHNMSFDNNILGAEFLREVGSNPLVNKKVVCTMKSSVDYCEIPGKYGYKWPTLLELHKKLFIKEFSNLHNAYYDVNATFECFWELKKKGVL